MFGTPFSTPPISASSAPFCVPQLRSQRRLLQHAAAFHCSCHSSGESWAIAPTAELLRQTQAPSSPVAALRIVRASQPRFLPCPSARPRSHPARCVVLRCGVLFHLIGCPLHVLLHGGDSFLWYNFNPLQFASSRSPC